MVLIRKRPDGLFERVSPDGVVDLFTLAEDDSEQGDGFVAIDALASLTSELPSQVG